ncbi:MAG: hypothetical protein AAF085_17930, partial [Planctomycetota bacterium]
NPNHPSDEEQRETYHPSRKCSAHQTSHATRHSSGLKKLEALLKEGLPQSELNRALSMITDQYWYVMQFDEKKPAKRLLEMAAAVLEAGADPNARNEADELFLVRMVSLGNGGNQAMVKLLLKHAADPHAQDAKGVSAVLYLAERPNAAYQRIIDEALIDKE